MVHKLTVALVAALALILMIGATAMAADTTARPVGPGQCATFVDANGDGICDNLGQATPPRDGTGSQYGSAQRQQAGPSANQGQGSNGAYGNGDGDGVCDNPDQNTPPRDGTGKQQGKPQSGGRGGRP